MVDMSTPRRDDGDSGGRRRRVPVQGPPNEEAIKAIAATRGWSAAVEASITCLDDIVERLGDIRWMRDAFGGDYGRLISGCEHCQAPPGAHWPDCDPDRPDDF